MKNKKIFIFIIVAIIIVIGIILYKCLNKELIGIEGIPTEPISINAQLTRYVGKDKKGPMVKNLIQEAIIYNQNQSKEDIENGKIVKVVYNGIDLATSFSSTKYIKDTEKYTVEIIGYNEQGDINELKITQQ